MASKRRRTEHKFSMVPKATIPRSVFSRSHSYKSAFDAGFLIPIYVDEGLPGDTFKLNLSAFARLGTPTYPVMDNAYMDFFFFSVPNRLLWSNWEKFQGAQDDPGDSIDFTVPQVSTVGSFSEFTIFDYMGLPTGGSGSSCNALPLRAYNKIYNTWFRDQNLQDSVQDDVDDGPDSTSTYNLLRRGKRHDYFTSALPSPQKGAGIELPLGTTAPVDFTVSGHPSFDIGSASDKGLVRIGSGPEWIGWESGDPGAGGTTPAVFASATDLGFTAVANLATATAATINSLREAFQLQKLLERDARGGTRYTEIIKSHFQVVSPDFRQQRPEYLGGGTVPIIVNAVPQTSQTATTPQGFMAAYGTASASGIGFSKSFTEHVTIIGLVSVRADITYQKGKNRMWNRSTRYDYYMPALAHLGEQSILNSEIYFQGSDHLEGGVPEDGLVFGYQERWSEYRYFPSLITGKLNSHRTGNLDEWHLAQEFTSIPLLDTTFIKETPPFDRVIATANEPHFIFDSYFQIQCARPMPVYSVPGYIDHF